mgnify:CR=1 FL=1
MSQEVEEQRVLTPEENLNKESKKIKENYEKAMGNLVAIFKGENNLAITKKIPNSDIDTLINEVLKEEVEEKKKDFKERAKKLMKSKVAYEQFIKQKEQEFQKAKDEKTKEFTKEANELIGIVESIGTLQQQYLESLTSTNS